jgi:hypothetical protein
MNQRERVRDQAKRLGWTTCLRLTFLLVVFSALAPFGLRAQSGEGAAFERAVLAAPASMRDGATVLDFGQDGMITAIREGTNGLICWDNQGRSGSMGPVDVQCTSEGNRPRLEQNHAFESAGGTAQDIQARFRRAEADGTRVLPVFGSIYYRVIGDSPDDLRTHTTVAVPFATQESIGFPVTRGPGTIWIMEAGTSSAHLMITGM